MCRTQPPGAAGSVLRSGGRCGCGLLFISPWIAGFLLFFTYPFFATIFYSSTNFNGVGATHWIGFANYVSLFHDPLFRRHYSTPSTTRSIELPLSTVVRSGLALLLTERQGEGHLPDDLLIS